MKKVNFNKAQRLTTPDAWLEKALAVPEAHNKKKAAVVWFRAASAACIIAAAVVSVTMFAVLNIRQPDSVGLSFPDKKTDPTAAVQNTDPSKAEALQPFATVFIQNTYPSEDGAYPPSADAFSLKSEDSTQRSDSVVFSDSQQPSVTLSNPAETQGVAEKTEESVTGTETLSDAPTVAAVQDVTITAVEDPAEQDTETPAETETAYDAEYVDIIIRRFYIPSNIDVYCKLTDASERILYGDADVFSAQHLCTVTERLDCQTVVSYSPGEQGILPEKGCYLCVFYDSMGSILSREKVYLNI